MATKKVGISDVHHVEDMSLKSEAPATQHVKSVGYTEKEHSLKTLQALRQYKQAVFWALFFGLSVIMWGYDQQVGGALLSSPQFRKSFGYVDSTGQAILPAKWQAAFNTVSSVGGFFGAISCGYIADSIGRRWTLGGACSLSIGAIFIQFFANSDGLLLAGKLINGYSLGFYWTVAPTYCSEIVPVVLRGAVTSSVNLFIAFGQLLGNGMIQGFGARTDAWAYRAPFALQWLFPVILIAGLPFCPESPWYYVRKGKHEEARKVLTRLAGQDADIEGTMSNIRETVDLELSAGSEVSYAECFRGTDLRRTLIAIGCFAVTQVSGISFVLGYSSYFFELAGLTTSQAFKMSMGVSTMGIVGNISSWFLCNSVGRRRSFFTGIVIMTIILFLIGILDVVPNYSAREQWGQAVLTVIYNLFYFMCVGGMVYIIFSEVSSARLRSRTVGLTIMCTNVLSIIINIIIPYMLNPDDGNWRGKTGFFFGALAAICMVWAFSCVPETKGRTFEELDIMFQRKIGTRAFRNYEVDVSEVHVS